MLDEFNTLSVVYGKPSSEFAGQETFERRKVSKDGKCFFLFFILDKIFDDPYFYYLTPEFTLFKLQNININGKGR